MAGRGPGTSCFLRDGDRVFHTYSSYARGAEATGGSYYYLDLTPGGPDRRARPEHDSPPRTRPNRNPVD